MHRNRRHDIEAFLFCLRPSPSLRAFLKFILTRTGASQNPIDELIMQCVKGENGTKVLDRVTTLAAGSGMSIP